MNQPTVPNLFILLRHSYGPSTLKDNKLNFYQVTEEDIIPKGSKILQIKYYRLIIKKPSFYYESTNGPKSVHLACD